MSVRVSQLVGCAEYSVEMRKWQSRFPNFRRSNSDWKPEVGWWHTYVHIHKRGVVSLSLYFYACTFPSLLSFLSPLYLHFRRQLCRLRAAVVVLSLSLSPCRRKDPKVTFPSSQVLSGQKEESTRTKRKQVLYSKAKQSKEGRSKNSLTDFRFVSLLYSSFVRLFVSQEIGWMLIIPLLFFLRADWLKPGKES